jgi:hypothetical protein
MNISQVNPTSAPDLTPRVPGAIDPTDREQVRQEGFVGSPSQLEQYQSIRSNPVAADAQT